MNVDRTIKLDALVERLAITAARYPFVRGSRLPGIALTTLNRMPDWRCEDPQLIVPRYLIWIFGIDDLSDNWAVPLPELEARYTTMRAVAAGAPPPPGDDLAGLLHEIVCDLSALPLWPALAATWRASFGDLLAGMAAERDPTPPASLADYLAYAHLSIGAMQDGWTLLLTLGDASALAQLPAITAALRADARTIRLANDLNSAAKELAEGKQNALTFLAGQGDARALTEGALAQALSEYHGAIAQVHTSTGRFEATITATVESTIAFYRRYTFHEFNHHAVNTHSESYEG